MQPLSGFSTSDGVTLKQFNNIKQHSTKKNELPTTIKIHKRPRMDEY